MNYKKLVLVGCISAFVAILTSFLGVAGTVIGSVISSVLYNMLSEALEKPVSKATFSTDFEWEIAYIFPLVVIAIIQLMLIFALMSEVGILPHTFLNVYLSLQDVANNNLYRLLGFALIVISAYPLILKPEFVKKEHGVILVFVGLIFLARGFVDQGNRITELYNPIFAHFDFPIAIIAFILLVFVIIRILMSANESEKEFKKIKNGVGNKTHRVVNQKYHNQSNRDDFVYVEDNGQNIRKQKPHKVIRPKNNSQHGSDVRFKRKIVDEDSIRPVDEQDNHLKINKSSNNIQFESNDLLDEYKK